MTRITDNELPIDIWLDSKESVSDDVFMMSLLFCKFCDFFQSNRRQTKLNTRVEIAD